MDKYPLHRAAKEGELDRVRQLIKRGMSVNNRDYDGRTPLHWAARGGRYEVVDFLSSLPECELNLEDRYLDTPVFLAANMQKLHVLDLLLQRGAQINCVDEEDCYNKWNLLQLASWHGWTETVYKILGTGRADLNAATGCGKTPLIWAAFFGREDVVSLLIRAGADVNQSDTAKRTALHLAANHGDTRVVQMLLEKGELDLNPQDGIGWTPLHVASFCKRLNVVEKLLVAGADTTIRNNDGETAFSLGIRHEWNLEVIRLFIQHSDASLEECDYVRISQNPVLKENILKDVEFCTQSMVNKYHCQSLPALKSKFKGRLPSIDKFKLLPEHICDVENFVKHDIEVNTFCNVIKARPIVLRIMCAEALLA